MTPRRGVREGLEYGVCAGEEDTDGEGVVRWRVRHSRSNFFSVIRERRVGLAVPEGALTAGSREFAFGFWIWL